MCNFLGKWTKVCGVRRDGFEDGGYGMGVEGIFLQERLSVMLYKYCCTNILARMPACLPGWMFLLNEGNTFVLGSMPC